MCAHARALRECETDGLRLHLLIVVEDAHDETDPSGAITGLFAGEPENELAQLRFSGGKQEVLVREGRWQRAGRRRIEVGRT